MKAFLTTALVLGYFSLGNCFTKYGRSCKDIGCPSTQQCVMETEPCSYGKRQNECGLYPTCKKMSNSARSCSNFVCPPGQSCRMDGDTPKCVDGNSKAYIGYDTKSAADNSGGDSSGSSFGGASAPVAPSSNSNGGGSLYPSVPKGETTSRPNINRPHSYGGSGYQGGQIGSGYPGQPANGYPQQSGGYPQPGGGYLGQYPQGGYNQYPQGGGYNQYPQGGYNQYPQGGYNNQGGYYNNNYNPYQQKPQNSGSPSISDKIGSALKTIGADLLKGYLTKAISGRS